MNVQPENPELEGAPKDSVTEDLGHSPPTSLRSRPWALFFLIFAVLIAVNHASLFSPPYWDAANGLYFQGAWLAQNDLSLPKLLSQPDFAHCGPRYGSLLLIPWLYAVLLKLSSPPIALLSLHLLSLALWSATLSLTYFNLKNSDSNSFWYPALWTLALALQPSSAAQAATIYSELPLALLSLLVLHHFTQRQIIKAAALVLLGVFLKDSALILALALAASWLCLKVLGRWPGSPQPSSRWAEPLAALGPAALLSLIYFGLRSASIFDFKTQTPWRAWTTKALREFPCELTLLFLTLLAAAIVLRQRARRKRLFSEPKSLREITFLAAFCWGFWLAHALFEHSLTRYLVFAMPCLYLLSARSLSLAFGQGFSALAAIIVLLFNLGNQQGGLLPPPPPIEARSGDILERSREFLLDLEQQQELCQFIESQSAGQYIIAKPPFVHLLTIPELGYVKKAVPNVLALSIPAIGTPAPLLVEEDFDKLQNPWIIYSPNFYENLAPPSLAPGPGDKILWVRELNGAPLVIYEARGK